MKKKQMIIGGIAFLSVALIVVILFLIFSNDYSRYFVLNNNGYAVSGSTLASNLTSAKVNSGASKVSALSVSASEIVYKKGSDYYVGENKEPINAVYPIFSNNSSSLLELTGKSSLINEDFENVPAYLGLILNNGLTFNMDMERAYREKFILVSVADGIYINTMPIKVSGSFVSGTIPVDSIIHFTNDEIRYYSLKGKTFTLTMFKPMSKTDSITVDGKTCSYIDFLKKLGIYQDENKTVVNTNPVSSSDTAGDDSAGLLGESQSNENSESSGGVSSSKGQSSSTASSSRASQNSSSDVSSIGKAALPATAAPADEAAVAPPVKQNQPTTPTNPVESNWAKPVVTLNDFVTGVYSVTSQGMTVENAEYLASSGVMFRVYDSKNNLVMTKSYNNSSDVTIEPLRPDTDFNIVVSMNYIDKNGDRAEETIKTAEVHTLPVSALTPLELNWHNGSILNNAINIRDLQITNAVEPGSTDNSGKSYIDTVKYLGRAEIIITSEADSSKKYTSALSSTDLASIRTGGMAQFESLKNLDSNTSYTYSFVFYDTYGNILPQKADYAGETHTSKDLPQAQITIIKNEVKNILIGIKFSNPDQAEIRSGSLHFVVYDSAGNPVDTAVKYQKDDGTYSGDAETGTQHTLSEDGDNILFSNLMEYSVYTIKVYGDCDVNDGNGMQSSQLLGETKFTTSALSALGNAVFNVKVQNLTDHGADVQISYNKSSTDPQLISLISQAEVSFERDDGGDETGIEVSYSRSGTDGNIGTASTDGKVELLPDDITALQSDNGSLTFHIDGLSNKTVYDIGIVPKVEFGEGDSSVTRDVTAYYRPNNFKTLKKTPVINANAIYASSDSIKLYGVTVNDPDGAVFTYPVIMNVYDSSGTQIGSYDNLSAQGTAADFNVTGLTRDQTYTFRFFADEYNDGYDNSSLQENYEIFYEDGNGVVQKPLQITTHEAVSGSIQVQSMNRYRINQSVQVAASAMTSPTLTLEKSYRFNGNGKTATYVVPVDFGSSGINSVRIQYSNNNPTEYKFYLSDPSANPGIVPFADVINTDSTLSGENARWTDTVMFANSTPIKGKQTVYVVASTTNPGSYNAVHYLWGLSFDAVAASDDGYYYANLNADVSDPRLELGDVPSYTVRVYKDNTLVDTREHDWVQNSDGSNTLNMYDVDGQNKTLTDSTNFSGSRTECNADFYYKVKANSTYRFEVWATVYGYQIQIGYEEFYTDKPIIGIKTEEDVRNIGFGMDKRYFALNDIALSLNTAYIGGNTQFTGELDFRGHKLTYASTNPLMNYIGAQGKVENMVITYQDGWGCDVKRTTREFFYTNSGTVNNIMLIRNNGNVGQEYFNTAAGLVRINYESGIIENFVVKLQGSMIATNNFAPVCEDNRGLIKQGYVYGDSVKTTDQSVLTQQQYTDTLRIGGVAAYNRPQGIIEDVFSTVDIDARQKLSTDDTAQGLVGYNLGLLRNSFYTGKALYNNSTDSGYGPAYRNYSSGSAQNVFYSSGLDYGNTDNQHIAEKLLYYNKWYQYVLSDDSGNLPYDLAPVSMQCYPHVNLSWLMPQQEYIKLPQLSENDTVQLLSANVTNQQDDCADAVVVFKNPENLQITGLTSQWLNFEVQSQKSSGDFCIVNVHITLPSQTKYYSSYLIDSFTYSYGIAGLTDTVNYADGSKPSVNAEFYKPVQTVQDWAAIKNDYQQNYRLENDLDFDYFPTLPVLAGENVGSESIKKSPTTGLPLDTYTGKLDGAGHTVNFGVQTANNYNYIIGKLGGTVKNLVVKNLNLSGTGQYKGFIARMIDGSVVNNVQVYDVSGISNGSFGAIAGTMRLASIVNSSVHNVTVRTPALEDDYQYIGGMVGRQSDSASGGVTIQNSYVDGEDLHMDRAADCMGIGGLIGYIRFGTDINNIYIVHGKIDTSYKNAGGVIGAADTYTDWNGSMYQLSQFYTDVDITTKTERAGGVIGFSGVKNADQSAMGLVLGDVTSSLSGANMISRYYGNTDSNTPINIYGYDQSRINGVINSPSSDLLSYDQLCSAVTYSSDGVLNWDDDFVRYAGSDPSTNYGILPKLKYNNSADLLPGQQDYTVSRDEVQVAGIQSSAYPSGNLFVVNVDTIHPAGVTIEKADFDSLAQASIDGVQTATITPVSDTETKLTYIVGLKGYYDNYYLTSLTYNEGGTDETENIHFNTGISPQYLSIGSAEEWNQKMSANAFGLKGYNIRITGDLDFSGSLNGSAASNVNIASLVGSDTGNWHTISGINLNQSQALIDISNGRIAYLNFKNITMNKSDSSSLGGFGLFRVTTGDMHDLNFQNITVKSQQTMFAGISALAYGTNYNITMQDVSVTNTYGGGTPSDSATGGLVGRLSGSGGIHDSQGTDVVVTSNQKNAGGFVGAQYQGRCLWNISMTNACVSNLTSTTANPYAGSIAGYDYDSSLSNNSQKLQVRQSLVAGGNYVGGITGAGSCNNSTADNVFVAGTSSNVGGISGRGDTYTSQTHQSVIYGSRYVGGITGDGGASICSAIDSVIGTPFDRNTGDSTNTIFQNAVKSRISYYSSLSSSSNATDGQKYVYTQAVSQLGNFTTTGRNNYFKQNPSSGDGFRVGGISPRGISFYNCTVANCSIGSYLANEVGGIVGAEEAPSVWTYWPYRVIGCGVQSSNVRGNNRIGGIAGGFYRDMMDDCYSNATVTASGTAAGGIVGYVQKQNVNLSETPYIEHVFFAGSVTANDYAAGIVGQMAQYLYNLNDGWLMLGSVKVTVQGSAYNAQFLLNKQAGELSGTTKAGVYQSSTVTHGPSSAATAQNYYAYNQSQQTVDNVQLVTAAQLKSSATYTSNLGWNSTYWNFKGLANNYMPYLTQSPWGSASVLNFYQEGYKPDPSNAGSPLKDSYGEYVYSYQSYKGGIPIPTGTVFSKNAIMMKAVAEALPEPVFYTVDADRLNIEFPQTDSNIRFEVLQGGGEVAESALIGRTFTLAYAFNSELEIRVTNGSASKSYLIWPQNLSRNVMTWGSDYYYLDGQNIEGSTANLPQKCQYLNLYGGHALDSEGNVYDAETGTILRKTAKTELLADAQPLYSFNYDGYEIKTFNGYSVANGVERDGMRLYVKDGKLSAVSSKMSGAGDCIILDSYDGNDYCSVLSDGGSIVDMTNPITLPKNFLNSNITYMTNSLDSTSHFVLVRYNDGSTAGFNYLTGETLSLKSPNRQSNLTTGGERASGVSQKLQTSYKNAISYIGSLVSSGWNNVNENAAASGAGASNVMQGSLNGATFSAEEIENALEKALQSSGSGVLKQQALQELAKSQLQLAEQQGLTRAEIVSVLLEAGNEAQQSADMETLSNLIVEQLTEGLCDTLVSAEEQMDSYGISQSTAQKIIQDWLKQSLAQGLSDEEITGTLKSAMNNIAAKNPQKLGQSELAEIFSQAMPAYSAAEEAAKVNYVPVYDTKLKKYVLYNENDLLNRPNSAIKSVNQKVQESGHLLNYQTKNEQTINLADSVLIGYIVLFALLGLISALLGCLIFDQLHRRRKMKN